MDNERLYHGVGFTLPQHGISQTSDPVTPKLPVHPCQLRSMPGRHKLADTNVGETTLPPAHELKQAKLRRPYSSL